MWRSGKESACQCGRYKRHGFDSWVWKIPWRRKWQPAPVFLPGWSHGQRSLGHYSPWVAKRQAEHTHSMLIFGWPKSYLRFSVTPYRKLRMNILANSIHMSMCVSKSGSVCAYRHRIHIYTHIHTYIHTYVYIKQE